MPNDKEHPVHTFYRGKLKPSTKPLFDGLSDPPRGRLPQVEGVSEETKKKFEELCREKRLVRRIG